MKHIGKSFIKKVNGKEELIVISLQAHVNNVKSLVEAWSTSFWPSPSHRDKLVEASLYHDEAKKFAWTVNPFSSRISPPERHALRGAELHRHNQGESCDVYVYWLIRLHHSFKAEYIAEAMSEISEIKKKDSSGIDHHDFARDLYLLITCDWLDSIMLNYMANAGQQETPREPHPFEEFILSCQGSNEFRIEPANPFEQSVSLLFEYARLPKAQFDNYEEFRGLLNQASWEKECFRIRGRRDGL